MNRRSRDAQSKETVERRAVEAKRGRPTSRRSADGTDGVVRIDLAIVCCAIGLSLAGIPLLVGYALAGDTVPSPDSTAFDALGAVVMSPGLLMGRRCSGCAPEATLRSDASSADASRDRGKTAGSRVERPVTDIEGARIGRYAGRNPVQIGE